MWPAGRMWPSRPSRLALGDFFAVLNVGKFTHILYKSANFMEFMLNRN